MRKAVLARRLEKSESVTCKRGRSLITIPNVATTPGHTDIKKEEKLSEDSKLDYEYPRRLVVCLDGTWNQRDSGTNIYHLANLVLEGKIHPVSHSTSTPGDDTVSPEVQERLSQDRQKTWIQMVYYDEGVGTGLLDSATGGAMGVGLSENVRQAYDWLVERYREGDHIYIFGFSRGAFTARSLVGLISSCGLLYRGAPLPPEQLWDAYKKMGPDIPPSKELASAPPRKWWQPFGQPGRGPFHRLKYLKSDPWNQDSEDFLSNIRRTETEKLLCQWSRRVPIECLAVYDTVRTLGIEALAIPWLRDRRSQFHNTRLTSLIQNGFHGLAIDEHRANFSHVPWHRKTKLDTPEQQDRTSKYGPIKQQWFIGAHANVGGSYYNDTLALPPLRWFIDECSKLNLVFKPLRRDERDRPAEPDVREEAKKLDACLPLWKETAQPGESPHVVDSYTEFASGIWRYLIRAKRNYRRIAPPPEFQDGEEVLSRKEELHPSVLELVEQEQAARDNYYLPPNLYEFLLRRANESDTRLKLPSSVKLKEPPPHVYCDGDAATGSLLVWLFGIGWGGAWLASFARSPLWYVLAGILPIIAWLADWAESAITHKHALEPDGPKAERRDAGLDVLMNVRIAAIALFVIGAGYFVCVAIRVLSFPLPLAELLWLIAFCLALAHFNASKTWAAQPMEEAGFGSIVALQKAKDSGAVTKLLRTWMNGPLLCSHQRLTPVYRTLWRDMVGFIPAYAIAFFFGLWVLTSLVVRYAWPACYEHVVLGLLCISLWCWLPAALITGIAVIADYAEDVVHLRYLHGCWEPPKSVWRGRLATGIKTVFAITGLIGLAAAIWFLGLLQFYRPLAHGCPWFRCYGIMWPQPAPSSPAILNFAAGLVAMFLAYSTAGVFLKRDPQPK